MGGLISRYNIHQFCNNLATPGNITSHDPPGCKINDRRCLKEVYKPWGGMGRRITRKSNMGDQWRLGGYYDNYNIHLFFIYFASPGSATFREPPGVKINSMGDYGKYKSHREELGGLREGIKIAYRFHNGGQGGALAQL